MSEFALNVPSRFLFDIDDRSHQAFNIMQIMQLAKAISSWLLTNIPSLPLMDVSFLLPGTDRMSDMIPNM